MTTLTMRMVKGDFIVTGPDIEPMKFKTRPSGRQAGGSQETARATEPVKPARGRAK